MLLGTISGFPEIRHLGIWPWGDVAVGQIQTGQDTPRPRRRLEGVTGSSAGLALSPGCEERSAQDGGSEKVFELCGRGLPGWKSRGTRRRGDSGIGALCGEPWGLQPQRAAEKASLWASGRSVTHERAQ